MQERRAGPALSAGPDVDDVGADGSAPRGRPAPGGDRRLAARPVVIAAVGVATFAGDQLTKWWALERLDTGDVHVIGSLRLHLVFNRGASFGLGSRFAPLIALVALVVVVLLLRAGRRMPNRWSWVAVGLVLGGALGNLADRIFRAGDGWLGGAVVDFVDLQWWPVFNVADVAIVGGGILLALTAAESGTDHGDDGGGAPA